jgi:MoxR-like ATPase
VESIEQSKQDDLRHLASLKEPVYQSLAQHLLRDDFVIELLLASIIARGHVLVVDVPSIGKTTLAQGLPLILGQEFNRIQFTNDILPADILGGSIYNANEAKFTFSPGPIFTGFLLADEIDRAPTRSQSAVCIPTSYGRRICGRRQSEPTSFKSIYGDRHAETNQF